MIALAWFLFALLALFWTGAAWVTAAATGWVAQALASGTAAQAARDWAALPLPEWLKFWVDPAWLQAVQSAVQWATDALAAGVPFAGTASGWLVPIVWVAWGLGMVLLVAGTGVAHVLLRRFGGRSLRGTPVRGMA